MTIFLKMCLCVCTYECHSGRIGWEAYNQGYYIPFSSMHAQSLNHVPLFATPWTTSHQAPLPMEFSRQEYWSGLPFPSPIYIKELLKSGLEEKCLKKATPHVVARLWRQPVGLSLWEGVNRWVDTRIVWLLEAKDHMYM